MYITNGFYGLKKNIDKFIMINLIPNIVGMLLMSFGLLCGIIGFFNSFRQRKKNNLLKSAEETEEPKKEYISILKASDILSPKLTNEAALFLESHAESAFWYGGKDTDFQDCINKTIRISLYILSKCKDGTIKLFGQYHPSSLSTEVVLSDIKFEFINREFTTLNKGGNKNNRIENLSVKKEDVDLLLRDATLVKD